MASRNIAGRNSYRASGARPDRTLARFLRKAKRGPEWACWEWTAAMCGDGYGSFRINGYQTTAHRAAHMLFIGDIPDRYHVDHLCHNRACVNPAHLEAVTPQENKNRRRPFYREMDW